MMTKSELETMAAHVGLVDRSDRVRLHELALGLIHEPLAELRVPKPGPVADQLVRE